MEKGRFYVRYGKIGRPPLVDGSDLGIPARVEGSDLEDLERMAR